MNKFLFVSDLDHTLVGDDQALLVLSDRWQQHRQQYGTKIIYSIERSLDSDTKKLTDANKNQLFLPASFSSL